MLGQSLVFLSVISEILSLAEEMSLPENEAADFSRHRHFLPAEVSAQSIKLSAQSIKLLRNILQNP